MSGVAVEFVGGPLDGRQQWISADPMNPPATVEFTGLSVDWSKPLPDARTVRLVYRREPSHRDEGPLWLYRWAGEQP